MKTLVAVGLSLVCSFSLMALEVTGSGCAISGKHILTAYHVVKGAENIRAEFGSRTFGVSVVDFDEATDWALLESSEKLPHAASVCGQMPRIADEVYVLGYPSSAVLGTTVKYSNGVVSATSGMGKHHLMQITVPIQPGSSGAPVFNKEGLLVGTITSTINPESFYKITGGALPQNLNFAIKIPYMGLSAEFIGTRPASVEENTKASCLIRASVRDEASRGVPLSRKEPTVGKEDAEKEAKRIRDAENEKLFESAWDEALDIAFKPSLFLPTPDADYNKIFDDQRERLDNARDILQSMVGQYLYIRKSKMSPADRAVYAATQEKVKRLALSLQRYYDRQDWGDMLSKPIVRTKYVIPPYTVMPVGKAKDLTVSDISKLIKWNIFVCKNEDLSNVSMGEPLINVWHMLRYNDLCSCYNFANGFLTTTDPMEYFGVSLRGQGSVGSVSDLKAMERNADIGVLGFHWLWFRRESGKLAKPFLGTDRITLVYSKKTGRLVGMYLYVDPSKLVRGIQSKVSGAGSDWGYGTAGSEDDGRPAASYEESLAVLEQVRRLFETKYGFKMQNAFSNKTGFESTYYFEQINEPNLLDAVAAPSRYIHLTDDVVIEMVSVAPSKLISRNDFRAGRFAESIDSGHQVYIAILRSDWKTSSVTTSEQKADAIREKTDFESALEAL